MSSGEKVFKCFLIVVYIQCAFANTLKNVHSEAINIDAGIDSKLHRKDLKDNHTNPAKEMSFNPVIQSRLDSVLNKDGIQDNKGGNKVQNNPEGLRDKTARVSQYDSPVETAEVEDLISPKGTKSAILVERVEKNNEGNEDTDVEKNKMDTSGASPQTGHRRAKIDPSIFSKIQDRIGNATLFNKESGSIIQKIANFFNVTGYGTQRNDLKTELSNDNFKGDDNINKFRHLAIKNTDSAKSRQAKAINLAEKKSELKPIVHESVTVLSCSTNYTLDLTFDNIITWNLRCLIIISDVHIVVDFSEAPNRKYLLEFNSDKTDFIVHRDEDNLSPVCIPCDHFNSVCLYLCCSTFIRQPKYVSLHPYLTLGDNSDNYFLIGSLDLNLKGAEVHVKGHSEKHPEYPEKGAFRNHQGSAKDQLTQVVHPGYDNQPVVQYWNPQHGEPLSGDSFYHEHHDAHGYHGNEHQSEHRLDKRDHHHGNDAHSSYHGNGYHNMHHHEKDAHLNYHGNGYHNTHHHGNDAHSGYHGNGYHNTHHHEKDPHLSYHGNGYHSFHGNQDAHSSCHGNDAYDGNHSNKYAHSHHHDNSDKHYHGDVYDSGYVKYSKSNGIHGVETANNGWKPSSGYRK
ncbi:hypothetical protein M8J76_012418 [Diaphorina citri]|nr:hypothetical protein M8J75_006070 [Diaphorina citri]KAI5723896.1 hypothetical protein M8J76_012418 [Diaphorina citri]KAI5727642.1 hypothetical protein M8J77_005091 [Diaphorina citri]